MSNLKQKINGLHYLELILIMTAMLFMTAAKEASASETQTMPYLIKVNRACNTITIYEKDEAGNYEVPLKAIACSVGLNGKTITGTFQTQGKYRWKELMGKVWGQYSTRIVGGILFHSVYYYQNGNPASLATKEFNKLGTAASHGCIRLSVADAKWIYDNCNVGTTVIIYDDKDNPGPLGKPDTIKLPSTVRWDPTDPSPQNPFKDALPEIAGAKNLDVAWGDKVDLLSKITAKSSLGTNITSKLTVQGEVDSNVPGEYEIVYAVTDALGRTATKSITVTVEDSKQPPTLMGISDKTAGGGITVDRNYALSGVEAYCSDTKLDKKLIDVTIEDIGNGKYHITYSISMNESTCTEYATITVDREAPVLSGVEERYLEDGRIPDSKEALEGVSVVDNYSEMKSSDISVTITEIQDGSYLVIYEVKDEAGNSAAAQTIFYN